MLPKKHRFLLRKNSHFFSQADRKHFSAFSLFFTTTPSLVFSASVIVPKKGSPLATQRNKTKRIISELLYSTFVNKKDLQLVVLVRKPLLEDDLHVLRDQLKKLN